MIVHEVDPAECFLDAGDLATWLLFFLESHGASVVLQADRSVWVDLNTLSGLTEAQARRWAPVIVNLIPAMREILIARVAETAQ